MKTKQIFPFKKKIRKFNLKILPFALFTSILTFVLWNNFQFALAFHLILLPSQMLAQFSTVGI